MMVVKTKMAGAVQLFKDSIAPCSKSKAKDVVEI